MLNMKIEKICAIVISYNGGDEILRTIDSIYSQVGTIIVVDNGSNLATLKNLRLLSDKNKIEIKYLDANYGIASAQNIGVSLAEHGGADWVLMLDQDSFCDENMVKNLYDVAINHDPTTLGFCCPLINYGDRNVSISRNLRCEYINYAISSGCFYSMETLKNVGEQREDYFIDSVDFEYCLRLLRLNYKLIKVESAILNHKLGLRKKINFLKLNFYISIHSPIRRYYISRNHIFLCKEYWKYFPLFLMKKTVFLFLLFLQIIFLESNKIKNIENCCKGLFDGFVNRKGKFNNL